MIDYDLFELCFLLVANIGFVIWGALKKRVALLIINSLACGVLLMTITTGLFS